MWLDFLFGFSLEGKKKDYGHMSLLHITFYISSDFFSFVHIFMHHREGWIQDIYSLYSQPYFLSQKLYIKNVLSCNNKIVSTSQKSVYLTHKHCAVDWFWVTKVTTIPVNLIRECAILFYFSLGQLQTLKMLWSQNS